MKDKFFFIYPTFLQVYLLPCQHQESQDVLHFFSSSFSSEHAYKCICTYYVLMSFFLTYFIYAKLTKRWAGDEVYMQFVNRNCTAAVRFKVHKKYNFEESHNNIHSGIFFNKGGVNRKQFHKILILVLGRYNHALISSQVTFCITLFSFLEGHCYTKYVKKMYFLTIFLSSNVDKQVHSSVVQEPGYLD